MEINNPLVTIEMENGGVIKLELLPNIAPNSVNNFISLIKKGYYDGLIFHRVISGRVDAHKDQAWVDLAIQ